MLINTFDEKSEEKFPPPMIQLFFCENEGIYAVFGDASRGADLFLTRFRCL